MAITPRRKIEIVKRQAQCLDRYLAGMSPKQIGEAMGLSATTVKRHIDEALEERLMERSRNVDILIEEQLAILVRMRRAAWPSAVQGDVRSIDMILKIVRETVNLQRLNPDLNVNVEVTSVDAIERQIQQLNKQMTLEANQYEWEADAGGVQAIEAGGAEGTQA